MVNLQDRSPSLIIGLFLVLVLVCLYAIGPYYDFQTIVLFAFIPILAVVAFAFDYFTFNQKNKEFLVFLIGVLLMSTSTFYRVNQELFTKAYNLMIVALVASYIPIGLNKNKNYEIYFHIGLIVSILALIYIEYSSGNFNLSANFASERGSRHRFAYNANYYSYISYFANFSLFYIFLKRKNWFTLSLLIFLPIVLVILAFITLSRSGLFITIAINAIFWIYVVRVRTKNILQKIGLLILLVSTVISMATVFFNIYQSSQIEKRVSSSHGDPRERLIEEGLNVFADNPMFGVGLGQVTRYTSIRQFTHNSYVEVLAEHGIFGGIFLLILFGRPMLRSIKNLRMNSADEETKLNFLFFSTFLLYNNAYVFYKVGFAMLYFFLVISIQNKKEILKT